MESSIYWASDPFSSSLSGAGAGSGAAPLTSVDLLALFVLLSVKTVFKC